MSSNSMSSNSIPTNSTLFAMIGPGILVAATGVGAGDLATAAFTGSALGLTVLWAVVLGSFFKFVLNEGLARWQLATGTTLIEGCYDRFGQTAKWLFLVYLLIWSFLVGGALMSAIGVTCHAIFPLFGMDAAQANQDKIFYGVLHSVVAIILVQLGGYRLFERVMSICIGVMFVIVVVTAVAICPSWPQAASGLLVPRIPSGGVMWTLALMGGVGGTVTVLNYGYWIREKGRTGADALKTCRIDLATGYLVTAVFGLGMVIIGSSLEELQGGGAGLIVKIAHQLESSLGRAGTIARWAFLVGTWGAVVSSLLGVCQGIPYLFADVWSLRPGAARSDNDVDTTSIPYRGFLYAIALIPIVGLMTFDFQTMQKTYAVVGALFVPMLAAVLLVLNGRVALVGAQLKNSRLTSVVLVAILLFFLTAGFLQVRKKLSGVKRPPQVAPASTSASSPRLAENPSRLR